MAKRRLSRRQAWRIEKIQQDRIARAGKKYQVAEQQLIDGGLGLEQPGLVIAHYGGQVEIEALEGPLAGRTQRAHLRANLDTLVTGDQVAWRPAQHDGQDVISTGEQRASAAGTGVVTARMQRASELCRPDPQGALKPIAANIDQIIVTCAPEPKVFPAMLDRYLVAAEHQRIEPVLLLNKDDLLCPTNEQDIAAMLQQFTDIGYRTVCTSTRRERGLEDLHRLLAGRTSVFVGQSGVGKSSLINTLLPSAAIRVGELSASTGKGRHTTTTAKLFHFPLGGKLIDSPGVRDFGLWHMSEAEIADGFRELRPFLGHCRFRDCRHQHEPSCALTAAVTSGKILPRRLRSYHRLVAALQSDG